MSVTLPSTGKTRSIFDLVATSAGSKVCEVVVENDAVAVTCFVVSLGSGDVLDITIEETGNSPLNSKLVHRFPQASRALSNPQSMVIPVGGALKFTATYTGAVTFEMRGRAVSGASITAVQEVELVTTEADKLYRESVLCALDNMNNSLEKIVNHSRVITNIEEGKGDNF